jgi:hypothetical protein
MKLITKEVEKTLPPLYSQDEVEDPVCHLKFFTPDAGWTWYIVEGSEQEDGDWLFFCKVISPIVPDGELGYVLLSQLEQVRGALGLAVERDLWWRAKPLSQCK